MPGTWVIAARPSDSGMRRLMTDRPASVTSTRSAWAGRVDVATLVAPSAGSGRDDRVGGAVERVEDRPGLLGRQPAFGDQPQDVVQRGVVSHPPARVRRRVVVERLGRLVRRGPDRLASSAIASSDPPSSASSRRPASATSISPRSSERRIRSRASS